MTFVRGEWSEQELDVLRDKCKLGWSNRQISEVLPGRTVKAIKNKRVAMNPGRASVLRTEWSEQELGVISDKFLLGWSDRQISEVLPGRSESAIQNKRAQMNLTNRTYPNRPKVGHPQPDGRIYSVEEDQDILTRYNNGEDPEQIAPSYHVSARVMEAKIDRMLLKDSLRPSTPTGRSCLRCRGWFVSKLPKKLNRCCPNCKSMAA